VESVPTGTERLKPGAVKMINQRLKVMGALPEQTVALHEEDDATELSASSRAALMRFQQANQLPATGEPDVATVRRLGLNPTNIFELGPAPR
jgi:hypothetical protein